VLDVGCGFGVPATYLLAAADGAHVVAAEPDPERARIARLVLGARGEVHELAAPALPAGTPPFDLALLLDVAHYLDDDDLVATLAGIRRRLAPDGVLLMRATVPLAPRPTWLRRVEAWRLRRRGLTPRFRGVEALAAALEGAGFKAEIEPIAPREEALIVARPWPAEKVA